MKNMDERIATLEGKLKELKERHQRAEAKRKRLEAQQSKKADVRRKLLVGTIVLARVERGELGHAELRQWLDGALTHSDDRALFDL